MESYLVSAHFDLISPDGMITQILHKDGKSLEVLVRIEKISPAFMGFKIDQSRVIFNLKSTLAQIGVNGHGIEFYLDSKGLIAEVKVLLTSIGPIAQEMLKLITPGAYIGKLFAADERRRVRDPDYLQRMFGRADRFGKPLLSLGGLQGSEDLILEKVDGRTVAYLHLHEGILSYEPDVFGFLPTIARALKYPKVHLRTLLQLDQTWHPNEPRIVQKDKILLVRTRPLHVRTVFGKVIEELLPEGFHHTSACVLEPTTKASGDVYELYGSSEKEINDIPLEFYTLEPHREHVFFQDRDQLQICLENPLTLFKAFETAPAPEKHRCAVFVVKGDQMLHLSPQDWISREPRINEFPGLEHPDRQAQMVERYIQQQACYPFLKAIEDGLITSQGVLFVRYFPSPMMKRLFLSSPVQKCLKGIYFQYPSLTYGDFFSHEDRSLLLDLAKFAIPVYWLDKTSGKILQYVPKPEKDAGMFVPLSNIENFIKMTAFGIYGSNLINGHFEEELTQLLEGILELKEESTHYLLNRHTPIGLVTGGGPGVMEVGNRVAKKLNILSCANIVDFRAKKDAVVNEQKINPYIDAKMTYRLDRLVERQAEFNLDFPIFLTGGIGTDFEYALEEVRRKVGSAPPNPILLFGEVDYWKDKITSRFQRNLQSGTISGSEWVSNCFFCIRNATQGLKIYKQFVSGTLEIGKNGPVYKDGFVIVE